MKPINVICSVCNTRSDVESAGLPSVREDFACKSCGATLRFRDQAACIVDEFGNGAFLSLSALVNSGQMKELRVYEAAIRGHLKPHLSKLPSYVASYYWEDVPLGTENKGMRCEDLRALTFADDTFDLVVTSDVLEHVFDPYEAFRDINRVLKRGGVHIFSIPVKWPMEPLSRTRCYMADGMIIHQEEPVYHKAGDGSQSLVVTDWGLDMIEQHKSMGIRTSVIRRSLPVYPWYSNATFVSRKM